MKSDRAHPFGAHSPAADAFEAFFDMVDSPAALCSVDLKVLTANPAFEVLCGVKDVAGMGLDEVLAEAPIEVPEEGRTLEVDVVCRTGQNVKLTVSRRGQTVALVARGLSPTLDSLAAAGRALIEQARVEGQLLEIGRQVAGATSEEELVAAVARGVKNVFPSRAFGIRIVDPRTCELTSLYAEGRLKDGVRDTFHLRQSMVEKTHLDASRLPGDRVVVGTSSELPLLFEGTTRGISVPLVASGQFFGVVNVEYPRGLTADVLSDERILIQLANQVAVAVRNAKLIDELTFMRKYLEELLEHANALILVTNREGQVVVFNRALEALTGRGRAEVLGQELTSLVPEGERLKVMRGFGETLKGGGEGALETVLLGDKGREMRVTFNTSTVMSQAGEAEGVIAIGQDLTRMRELERRIVQAEKLASLGQLAASVVHEINNPMTAVVTYADALLQRALSMSGAGPGDIEKFRKILDNADRVLRFTRDLVSYARPAQEKPEEVDLNHVIDRAVGFCEHVLSKTNVTVEKSYGALPRFYVVRQNVMQVFVNLITNACHAMDNGGHLKVSSEREGEVVTVKVVDNGPGIPLDVQPRIFEPFFTTKAEGKGTGLGLSIVQGIVEGHGGTIAVDSTPGVGTTFLIRLPIVRPFD